MEVGDNRKICAPVPNHEGIGGGIEKKFLN